jgi:hypothetical protein
LNDRPQEYAQLYANISIRPMLESGVCVRYRHCERDAVDIGDGAPSVTRHPRLFKLLVCLRHVSQRKWSELDAVIAKCCLGETRRRAVLFEMARASGVQTSLLCLRFPLLISSATTSHICEVRNCTLASLCCARSFSMSFVVHARSPLMSLSTSSAYLPRIARRCSCRYSAHLLRSWSSH